MKKKVVEKANYESPERFKLAESGFRGLPVFNGFSQTELIRELNFPQNVKTFKEMASHSTINASLTLFLTIIGKADWKYNPPELPSAEEIRQVEIINEMMHDMDGSWAGIIQDALSGQKFGFAVLEKVYRRRYQSNGSKFNDGIIGWKKLALRSQESIDKFIFTDDGNEIIGVKQNLTQADAGTNRYTNRGVQEVILPVSKILHFRMGAHRDDPYGKSPLADAYIAWKYIVLLEELEATGVSKDLVGLPILYMPPQYLNADGDENTKKIREYYENALRNIQMNEQSAMILPNMFDPESGKELFKLELLSVDGKKSYDISKIKEYYKNLIMISMSTDILTMGQTQVGSFALGSIKNSMAGSVAFAMCKSICEVLNKGLVRQTYELNGWDISRMGSLDFDNLIEVDLESQSKFLQRVMSVGLLEADREMLNSVRVQAGVDPLDTSLPPQKDLMTETSKSGEGMKTMGEGTSTSVSGNDSSSNNTENSA